GGRDRGERTHRYRRLGDGQPAVPELLGPRLQRHRDAGTDREQHHQRGDQSDPHPAPSPRGQPADVLTHHVVRRLRTPATSAWPSLSSFGYRSPERPGASAAVGPLNSSSTPEATEEGVGVEFDVTIE